MLESLGYTRGRRTGRSGSHPLQHLLDPREGRRAVRRPSARGQGPQEARPGAGHRGRRLLGAVGQGRGVPPVPVRRRRVRPGPGPQARRVPHQRLAHRPGLLRVRGLHRPPAAQARAGLPGVDADLRRLQLPLLVLHRAVAPAVARSVPPAHELVAEAHRARRRRRPRAHPARPERQLLRPRPQARPAPFRRAAARARRGRRPRPHPLHEPAPQGHARGRDPRAREPEERLRAHPPAAAVRLVAASSRRCAARTTAAATWIASR